MDASTVVDFVVETAIVLVREKDRLRTLCAAASVEALMTEQPVRAEQPYEVCDLTLLKTQTWNTDLRVIDVNGVAQAGT